jgi:hypothetical protein
MSTSFSSIKQAACDEATQRVVLGAITDITVFVIAFSVLNAALSLLLWAWLAWLIASVIAVIGSFAAGVYAQSSGYDHAVSAVASVRGWFSKVMS